MYDRLMTYDCSWLVGKSRCYRGHLQNMTERRIRSGASTPFLPNPVPPPARQRSARRSAAAAPTEEQRVIYGVLADMLEGFVDVMRKKSRGL